MILVRLMGGLGNQMFQYATAFALAYQHNTSVQLDLSLLNQHGSDGLDTSRDYALDVFNIDATLASEQLVKQFNPTSSGIFTRIVRKLRSYLVTPQIYVQKTVAFEPEVLALPDNMCIVGSFQSEQYFKHVESLIRRTFTFRETSFLDAVEVANDIRSTNAVAVHVRRGDYIAHANYSQILGAKGVDYYTRAFQEIRDSLHDPVLFVFSDDIEWCKANLPISLPHKYVSKSYENGCGWKDLKLMSMCRHFVIPNSTFGWWGAWLGQDEKKKVFAPKVWSANGAIESNDRIPASWIRI